MDFYHYSFRHAQVVLQQAEFIVDFNEVLDVVKGITEEELIIKHNSYGLISEEHIPKSLSKAINDILKESLVNKGWHPESKIFQDSNYEGETWRLDFAKNNISIEVGFNHASVIAWNLTKPVLASELNHVKKAIQTKVGIIIAATEDLKQKGGFDGAIGTYEKYLEYLPPLNNILTVPLFIIGLKAPLSFKIKQFQLAPRKKIGKVNMLKA